MNSTFNVDELVQEIEEQGYTIIPDAITSDQVNDAIVAVDEVFERERPIAERFGE